MAADNADLERALLGAVPIADSWAFAERAGADHNTVVGVLKSLAGDEYVTLEQSSTPFWEPTEEGRAVAEAGSPEVLVFNSVPESGADRATFAATAGLFLGAGAVKVGMNECMKRRWLSMDKASGLLRRAVESVTDDTAATLQNLAAASADQLNALKRRKLAAQRSRTTYAAARGPQFARERTRAEANLTVEMLQTGAWRDARFKEINFQSLGAPVAGGNLHPLLSVREQYRHILMQMGFEEMPTNKYVESSFWNFDALFQPQSHPARDAHDTFFLKSATETRSVPEDYYERVRATHENGGESRSLGYRYDFQRGEAMKNILRTHTTAISSQMLYKLAQQPGGFQPKKYFSIDRVFRNESMDATHLCEFHQVEGLVADYDLSLGDLIGVIKTFFAKIGITRVRFKPAYNPYTEPSMEIFGFHPDLGKWCELGNSGIFRPEMLTPMGLPPNVRVIAWGLGLERQVMIKYRQKNIRDLFGHKIDLAATKVAPLARYEQSREGVDMSEDA